MDIEHDLTKAYFENNGFWVRQAGKIETNIKKKKKEALISMAIFNPSVSQNSSSMGFRLYTGDLIKIRLGMVSLMGWGNTDFTNGMLTNDTLLLKYFKKEVKENRVQDGFDPGPALIEYGIGSFFRLLVVPSLPKNENKVSEIFSLLKSIGVDGVFTFRSILENLLRISEPSKVYLHTPILEVLKLLKSYELAKDPQLEMFE